MKIEFLSKFNKDILKIKDKKAKKDILDVIENVELAKNIKEIKNIKKLVGFKVHYRIKMGDYRMGVIVENNVVEFLRIIEKTFINYFLSPLFSD